MQLPFLKFTLFSLLLPIYSSLAVPITEPLAQIYTSLPSQGSQSLRYIRLPKRTISAQGSGPLRYKSWKILHRSLAVAITAATDPQTISQTFDELWNKVALVLDGFRGVSEEIVPALNHIRFEWGDVELILTSTERMLWDDMAGYGEALLSLVGERQAFWEVSRSLQK